MKKNTSCILISLVVSSLYVSGAEAVCTQRTLKGTWVGSLSIVDAPISSQNYSSFCELQITSEGSLGPNGGWCETLSSNPQVSGKKVSLTSAQLMVGKDCAVTGTINTLIGGDSETHGYLIGSNRAQFTAAFKNTTGAVGTLSLGKR